MQTYYKPGSWNAVCDRTGFRIKAHEAGLEWNGLRVRKRSFDYRNPLDLLRGIPDNPATPWALPQQDFGPFGPSIFLYDTNLLNGRYWQYGGYWTALTGEAWQKNNEEWTNDPISLRPGSFVPVGSSSNVSVGTILTLSFVVTGLVVAGGMIFGYLKFYSDHDTPLSTSLACTFDEYDETGSWQTSGAITVPSGSAFIQVIFAANALSGEDIVVSTPSLSIGGVDGVSTTTAWAGDIPVSAPVGPSGDGSDSYTAYDLGI